MSANNPVHHSLNIPNEIGRVVYLGCNFHCVVPLQSPSSPANREKIWCQRRDSNSQTRVSKTGRHSNSRTLEQVVHRGGFEPPRPTRGDRVTAGPFRPGSRTCANLAEGRRIERPSLITTPWFSEPVADHSAVPSAMAESAGVEPASLLRYHFFPDAFLSICDQRRLSGCH